MNVLMKNLSFSSASSPLRNGTPTSVQFRRVQSLRPTPSPRYLVGYQSDTNLPEGSIAGRNEEEGRTRVAGAIVGFVDNWESFGVASRNEGRSSSL